MNVVIFMRRREEGRVSIFSVYVHTNSLLIRDRRKILEREWLGRERFSS
jgi:hypothetical protein